MDGDADDVQLLLASAQQEIAALKGDPRLRPFEGNRGKALRQHVLDLIGAAEHRIGRQPFGDAPARVRKSFSRSLRDIILILRAAHAAMPWIEATQSPGINLGSLYLTEECAEMLVGSKVDLVIVPDIEFMYSTISWPFSEVIDETRGFSPKTDRRPIVLHYPLSDSNRLLLHAIFSHELGHSAVAEANLVNIVQSQLDEDPDFGVALEKATEAMRAEWPANSETRTVRTIRQWLRGWVEELLCDQLAIEASGPAYLWAFAGFVLPLSYADEHPIYPPNTLRVKLALDLLDANGWRPYMEKTAPAILRWLDSVGAESRHGLEPPYDFLRDQIERRADLLRTTAAAQLNGSPLQPGDAVPEADAAADLLKRMILPVGLDGALAPRSIMLGGWQEAIRLHGDNAKGLVSALGDSRLQDLVGKAIEMSTVVEAWRSR